MCTVQQCTRSSTATSACIHVSVHRTMMKWGGKKKQATPTQSDYTIRAFFLHIVFRFIFFYIIMFFYAFFFPPPYSWQSSRCKHEHNTSTRELAHRRGCRRYDRRRYHFLFLFVSDDLLTRVKTG